jgi:hypothetical protein
MQIIRPTEFAAFATLVDSGAACDADGMLTNADDASCIIFATLDEAEAFCRERVAQLPGVRFDIRDSAGPLRPPILTIVHPSRAEKLDGSPSKIRLNARLAIALVIIAPLLFWWDWGWHGGNLIMPTIVGINALLIAARLLIMNYSHASFERARQARVDEARRRQSAGRR